MGKPRYFQHPRAIIQKRWSKKSKHDTLTITLPHKAIERTGWLPGDILEFLPITENDLPLVKLRKIRFED